MVSENANFYNGYLLRLAVVQGQKYGVPSKNQTPNNDLVIITFCVIIIVDVIMEGIWNPILFLGGVLSG